MSFTPTTAQLELLAELETARMPMALMAARLGVDKATLKAWLARLDAARDYVEPVENIAEILRKIFPSDAQRQHGGSRVVADRMFNRSEVSNNNATDQETKMNRKIAIAALSFIFAAAPVLSCYAKSEPS